MLYMSCLLCTTAGHFLLLGVFFLLLQGKVKEAGAVGDGNESK